jgi:hypothetical protein
MQLDELLNLRSDLCPSARTQVLRYYKKVKPMIIEGKTEDELHNKLQRLVPLAQVSKTYNARVKDGFITCTIRSLVKVYEYDYVIKTNYGISADTINLGRSFVCYRDVRDISSEVYVALVNTGDKYDNNVKTDSLKSMYSK